MSNDFPLYYDSTFSSTKSALVRWLPVIVSIIKEALPDGDKPRSDTNLSEINVICKPSSSASCQYTNLDLPSQGLIIFSATTRLNAALFESTLTSRT